MIVLAHEMPEQHSPALAAEPVDQSKYNNRTQLCYCRKTALTSVTILAVGRQQFILCVVFTVRFVDLYDIGGEGGGGACVCACVLGAGGGVNVNFVIGKIGFPLCKEIRLEHSSSSLL